jgi:polyribonucleotide nucleotidyltransferase
LYIKKHIDFFGKVLNLEIGKTARNTASSVLLDIDGTTVLVTIVYGSVCNNEFFPLKIDYSERFYSSGKIPCNYYRREGKPSEREILIARLIDRSIRPMFPKNLNIEIQISVTVLSINFNINPDIIAINGVSIALMLSELPFEIIACIRVCYRNGLFIINPLSEDMVDIEFEMIISGNNNKISMIEGSFKEISCDIIDNCFNFSLKNLSNLINLITNLNINNITKNNKFYKNNDDLILDNKIIEDKLSLFYEHNEINFKSIKLYKEELCNQIVLQNNFVLKKDAENLIFNIEKKILRDRILKFKFRIDNRSINDIRLINIENKILKNVHSSSLFTRGGTQSLAIVTLGTYKDAQNIDCVFFSNYKNNFILHYNFLPYAVNEIGNLNIVKRREIGHGNLAKNAIISVLPSYNDFPYTIRIVSEILESNGSSSMATICSSSLALMECGVPIKKHVAGVAMGLIKNKNTYDYVILTDISEEEDFIGDMDFKIAGTIDGITAIQMDLKIDGIELEIIRNVISDGFLAVKKIISIMNQSISRPSKNLPLKAPKIKILKIDKDKIKDIVGKNGIIIKELIEKYNCDININNEGIIKISSLSYSNIVLAVNEIKILIKDFKLGMILKGKIVKMVQFGCFVNLSNKIDGFLHISKINNFKIKNPIYKFEEGSIINVIIDKIDLNNKIGLSIIDE